MLNQRILDSYQIDQGDVASVQEINMVKVNRHKMLIGSIVERSRAKPIMQMISGQRERPMSVFIILPKDNSKI